MRLLSRIVTAAALGGLALGCGGSRITDNTVDQPKMQTTAPMGKGKKEIPNMPPAPPIAPSKASSN